MQTWYIFHKQYIEIMKKHASIYFQDDFKLYDTKYNSYRTCMLEILLLMRQEMQQFKGNQITAWKYFLFLKGIEKMKERIKNHVNEITLLGDRLSSLYEKYKDNIRSSGKVLVQQKLNFLVEDFDDSNLDNHVLIDIMVLSYVCTRYLLNTPQMKVIRSLDILTEV